MPSNALKITPLVFFIVTFSQNRRTLKKMPNQFITHQNRPQKGPIAHMISLIAHVMLSIPLYYACDYPSGIMFFYSFFHQIFTKSLFIYTWSFFFIFLWYLFFIFAHLWLSLLRVFDKKYVITECHHNPKLELLLILK